MAGGEARAVWQRTVNRYFVQEDAKRAPKLTTSYQSSSSSTTKQQVVEEQQEEEEEGSPSSQQASIHPQNQSPSPGFMPLHRNRNFPDMNTRLWDHYIQQNSKEELNKKPFEEVDEVNTKTSKSLNSESFQEFMESYDSIDHDETKLNDQWNPLSSEKSGPWWRTTDKEDLVSLVAQRSSLDYVENCDLPTPQKIKHSSYYGSPLSRDHFLISQSIHEHKTNRTEASSESGLSKSELLEALRHSQTRAREAENMAKEAYAEKEHLVKLLFKQASELFGYKQWLQLLQLESLYLQIKNKKIDKETPPPVSIPSRRKRRNKRNSNNKPNGAKYAVGLALGMSLVGAGLLLGWTVGWMQLFSF